MQEDFYQPEDVMNLLFARLSPLIYIGKRAGTVASNINAWVFQNVFGWWKSGRQTSGMKKAQYT